MDSKELFTEEILKELEVVRSSGLTNMYDISGVQRAAYDLKQYGLVCLVVSHPREYIQFVLGGYKDYGLGG